MDRRSSANIGVHQRLEAVTDLTHLSPPSDDIIVACLRERFMTDNIYTSVGSSGLVALNPHKYVSSNSDSVLHKYAAEYRDTSEHKQPLPPHIFQLANNAYYHMKRTTQDQAIVFSGETGSGKSENRRLAIKTLLELSVSNPGKKGSKLATQVPASEFVLESFGNARTLFNPNASRFGKYTELQFTERGRLCGIKTLDYYLERNRVAGAPSGERNFHIFYYLIAGASPEERQHLHLLDKTAYRYLGQRGAAGRPNGGRDDDQLRFEQLKVALKTIGLSKRHVAQTCQLIAAILHLGNLEFTIDRSRNEDAAVVRNTDLLETVAEFLGVHASALESALSYKTKLVKKELCTVFLDPDGASDNRDDLAKTLYSLLFAWLNEHINQRLCKDDFATFIGLFDLPGPQNMTSRSNSLDQFIVNFANERLQHWTQKRLFEAHVAEYNLEGISRHVPQVSFFDNSECVRLLQNRPGGLIHIMDDQARRAPRKTDATMVEAFQKRWGNHSAFKCGAPDRNGAPTFTVSHYNGPVTYSAEGFLERNLDALNPDFVSLLRGMDGQEGSGSVNPFVKGLFSAKAIATQAHPRNEDTIVAAQQVVKPMRAPSTRRKNTIKRMPTLRESGEIEEKDEEDQPGPSGSSGGTPCVAGEFRAALDTLFETLDETQAWYVFCINPNDSQLPNQLEGRSVKGQVRSVGLTEIAKRCVNVFEANMTPEEFCERYKPGLEAGGVTEGAPVERVQQARTTFGLTERDVVLGQHKVFLSHLAFHTFEDQLRSRDVEEQKRDRIRDAEAGAGLNPRGTSDPYAPYLAPGLEPGETSPTPWAGSYGEDNRSDQALPLVANASPFQRADLYDDDYAESKSFRSDDYDGRSRFTSQRDDTMSNFGSESYAPSRNMFGTDKKALLNDKEVLPGEIQDGETTEVLKESSARRKWVALCWILTFWVPTPLLTYIGRMKRMDVRQAWREKLAINLLIWLACGGAIFVITLLGVLICPTEHVFNMVELTSHSMQNNPDNTLISIRGEVFDLNWIAAAHQRVVGVVPTKAILKYGGQVADNLFPVQVSALCDGIDGNVSPYIILDSRNITDPNAQYHDFRAFTNDSRPDWYFENMVRLRYNARRGFVGYTPKEVRNMANNGRSVAIYKGLLYDVSNYISSPPAVRSPYGTVAPPTNADFMDSAVMDVFKFGAGTDVTKTLDQLKIDPVVLQRQKICLRNLFTIGKVDNRNSTQCQFATYLLLSLSIIMITVIGFKFLASVNFAAARAPEDHDKFVICQVPCYTEGDASLRRTIDSLAQLKYDDKRKLLVIICDGMIVGSGNDRPTPRIVLDILGADPNLDPEPLSFLSLGEGAKQHNMGKVYSGLYECAGHVVPYLVVVKVGKPTERSRPGNRGKRDSQMVLMHFLNKVHFNSPMNPLELEMYHQIKNVIGVNPTFYEYLFTVDADTTVDAFSVNRLISAMIHDKKLLGVCGETSLANAKQSIVTMMQVYEYFISHHMAKAFESLFGSVTCLPGCFTLYRLRTPDTHKPLLISNQLIEDYSENRVDTLHVKNLLHLGEDRYLTTLLLKHFPLYKTQFVRDAHAYTVAPDDWKVLLSQRRRWINSTVHNLGELIFLEQLCGFCCFSMRFVVMIDLISTIIQPVTVVYIAYLIYQVVGEHKPVPTLALILIGAIYGVQAAVFLLRRKWDMIGWMFFYILAIPAFSFFLPLYSFWRMDDFSWGQTRVVLGEKGKKMIVHDEGKFDPRAIPLKTWTDYENELWDKESNHSIGSWVPPWKMKGDGYAESHTASIYGRETNYEPRSYSPAPSQGGMYPPPGYNSGRNTPMSNFRPMTETGSLLHHPAPSRPVTNYLDIPIPVTTGSPDNFSTSGFPSDVDIERAVHNILRGADLNTVTKREIRRQLEEVFGMDLTSRKAGINAAIDRALLSQA
ncbi:putative TRAFAC class myosin-kinesin ATPase superfamily, myosin family protein [Lyophyllum shimeji]|uniref:chitin synthase n=1 Tax=Lyophyllum shimeji TaxID=47721 RepID=A0A9P3PQG6_LYOSH|nr:putative TRAFAC class myosin-kinesin ATPase superfamily, myosin family protein [Lyophyllum shimeji]